MFLFRPGRLYAFFKAPQRTIWNATERYGTLRDVPFFKGLGFRALYPEPWIQGPGYGAWIQGPGTRALDPGPWIQVCFLIYFVCIFLFFALDPRQP